MASAICTMTIPRRWVRCRYVGNRCVDEPGSFTHLLAISIHFRVNDVTVVIRALSDVVEKGSRFAMSVLARVPQRSSRLCGDLFRVAKHVLTLTAAVWSYRGADPSEPIL
jgi:hypothetical protein